MRRGPACWTAGLLLAASACAPAVGAHPSATADDGRVPRPPPAASTTLVVPSPTAAPAAEVPTAPSPPPWTAGVWDPPPADADPWGIWIPRIEVAATLGRLGLEPDGALEVPEDPRLAGWYGGGPRPGEVGPAVVVGHVDSRRGPAVFARLGELRDGDLAHVVYRDGHVATFRITSVRRYAKDAFPTAAVYGDTVEPALRLITCGGRFDRRAGSYRDNVVAFGEMLASWRYEPTT